MGSRLQERPKDERPSIRGRATSCNYLLGTRASESARKRRTRNGSGRPHLFLPTLDCQERRPPFARKAKRGWSAANIIARQSRGYHTGFRSLRTRTDI